jgi:hypothetical protein
MRSWSIALSAALALLVNGRELAANLEMVVAWYNEDLAWIEVARVIAVVRLVYLFRL